MGPLIQIGNRALGLLAVLTLTIHISYSQTPGSTVTCAVSAVPRQVHSEGVTEPLGNIVLRCSSSNSGASVTGNYTVFLPVDVTNRIDSNSLTTDAVISVDYGLGYVPVPGVSGRVSGRSISFNGVTVTVPGTGKFGIQISNVRANVSELGGVAGQQVMATLSGPLSVDQGQVAVANTATSLYASLHSNGINCTGSPAPATIDLPGFFAAGTAFFSTRVTEGFGTAFTSRGTGEDSGTRFLVKYTGFPANSHLYVPNLVAGYDALTPTAGGDLGLTQAAGQYVPGSGTLLLGLVTGADSSGAGGTPFAAPTGSSPVTLNSASEVALSNGSGYAVYEVLDANPAVRETAQFPTFLVLTQITGPAVAQQSLSLAPVSAMAAASATDPVPRFVASAPASDCGIVGDCQAGYFPKLSVAPIPINLTATAGGAAAGPGYIYVQNTGGGLMDWSTTVTYVDGSGWLIFDQSMHENSATVRVDAQAQGLSPGVYHANVLVDAGPLAGTATIPVMLTVQAAQVVPSSTKITVTGVLNPATMTATPVVAGSLGIVAGTNLAGKTVSVTFNGFPASLLYTSDSRIYVQVPAALGSLNTAIMIVTVDGTSSAPQMVQLAPAWPSIFAHAVRNQDFSENTSSNPARAGSTLQIFLTGIPAGSSVAGQIQNLSGLAPAYSGPAPGESGVQQVNLVVPAGLATQTTQLVICASAGGQQFCTAGYPLSID
ncbi:MAG TPA: hypothetical protein VG096_03305 [Bryobacteraceae bacterium]|nr:hypothetical protein [Bryobacteraceae bacterium]